LVALTLHNIRKSFGADEVLKDISLTVMDEQRLGLVGPNGAGKTTLLRIICGEMTADSGSVSVANPAGVGYLSQEVPAGTRDTVWQTMLAVFDDVFAMEKRMRELEHQMADAAEDSDAWRRVSREYERLTCAFEEAGGYGYKSAISGVLKGLGLCEETFEQPVDTLSGGQRARLALGRLLLRKPTLLLLDEPTNHLDADATEWLENYLKSWRGAMILVSHDRWFLDQLCTHVAGLNNGRLTVETGNYSAYAMKRQEQRRLQQKAYEHNQKEIKRQEAVIERYNEFEGTILFVSHDRYFINRVATRILELRDGALTSFEGNWSDYQAFLEARKAAAGMPAYLDSGLTKTEAARRRRAEREELQCAKEARQRVSQVEKEIAQAEQRLKQIETAMADPAALSEADIMALSGEYEQLQQQLDALMEEWEQALSAADMA
jgi:ATPase subunit of ABC transporter with duplicated ATPase domains